jgi:hypothetical protein
MATWGVISKQIFQERKSNDHDPIITTYLRNQL